MNVDRTKYEHPALPHIPVPNSHRHFDIQSTGPGAVHAVDAVHRSSEQGGEFSTREREPFMTDRVTDERPHGREWALPNRACQSSRHFIVGVDRIWHEVAADPNPPCSSRKRRVGCHRDYHEARARGANRPSPSSIAWLLRPSSPPRILSLGIPTMVLLVFSSNRTVHYSRRLVAQALY